MHGDDFGVEIKTVKVRAGSGYLLNGSINVPENPGNLEYKAIQEWIAKGNVPEPELTEEELRERAWEEIEAQKKEELLLTNWLCFADVWEGFSPGVQNQIKTFRSNLRAIGQDRKADPLKVVFPDPPEIIKTAVDEKLFIRKGKK